MHMLVAAALALVAANDPSPQQAPAAHPANAAINEAYVARVRPIFAAKCFDCHSDKTVYPWYHALPIIRGFLDGHIEEGREHLELSNDFPFGGKGSQSHLLDEIVETIETDEMPPWSYGLMHWSSGITEDEEKIIRAWVDEAKAKLAGS